MELMQFRKSEAFSEKEKAMLSFVEEATLNKSVSETTFDTLKNHFTEKEIVEITWVNATENYYTLLAKPLGLTSDNLS
jgi:alkylhydroperoxidase family enzyme